MCCENCDFRTEKDYLSAEAVRKLLFERHIGIAQEDTSQELTALNEQVYGQDVDSPDVIDSIYEFCDLIVVRSTENGKKINRTFPISGIYRLEWRPRETDDAKEDSSFFKS